MNGVGELSVFGKLPGEGDFVGVNHTVDSRQVERWLAETNARLITDGADFPRDLQVLLQGNGRHVGAFRPSRDAVGRKFPIGFLRRTSHAGPGTILAMNARLLEQGLSVLETPNSAESIAISLNKLGHLVPPQEHAEQACETVAQTTTISSLVAELFEGNRDAFAYALRTFGLGLRELRTSSLSLLCPVRTDVHQYFWCQLADTLGIEVPVTLWVETPVPRMVFSSDPPNGDILKVLLGAPGGAWCWPLTTTSEAAKSSALAVLSPVLSGADESMASFVHRFVDFMKAGGLDE